MAFQLAIDDTVHVPVKLSINSAGIAKTFDFTLICTRLPADELKSRAENKNLTMRDIVKEVTRGWTGQSLVLDEQGKPAEFSQAALAAMLGVSGVGHVLYVAYGRECAAKEKN